MAQTLEEKRAYRAAYRDKNRDKLRQQGRAYNAANREKILAYNATHRDEIRLKNKAYYAANPEKYAEQRRRARDAILKDPQKWLQRALSNARGRARKKGITFDISIEDVFFPSVCPFTLLPFIFCPGKKAPDPQSPSLDRIKPDRGYIRGNVRVISFHANAVKSNVIDSAIFQRLADDARLWSLV